MVRLLALVGVALCVGACQEVRGTGERFISQSEIDAKDESTCKSFGAAPGTQPYVDCRLRLRSDRSNQDTMRRYAF